MSCLYDDSQTTSISSLSLHDALPILNKEKGTVTLRSPSPRALESVKQVSTKAGERGHVSQADREVVALALDLKQDGQDRKSTRLNSSHANISYAVFCLNKTNRRWIVH